MSASAEHKPLLSRLLVQNWNSVSFGNLFIDLVSHQIRRQCTQELFTSETKFVLIMATNQTQT